jgi:small subunit ribosomal protein S8
MSMQDPIADMFTRIRNGQMARMTSVAFPASKFKMSILKILKDEGYIEDYAKVEFNEKPGIEVTLKYFEGQAVINKIERRSSPGLRLYSGVDSLPQVKGFGTLIVSTPQGVKTGRDAKKLNLGGEIIGAVA